MYLDFFKLRELPFRLTADRRFIFLGVRQELAKVRLRNALRKADGCLLLEGDSGVGKSILVQDILAELPEDHTVAQIRHPEISINEFYQTVLVQLEETDPPETRSALLAAFDSCVARQAAMRRTVVLVIDNGELLSPELLGEILQLPQRRGRPVRNLRVVIAARPARHAHRQESQAPRSLAQLSLKVTLAPLTQAETRQYLDHRLTVAAGAAVTIFEEDAYVEFHRYTGGVPRLLNILADAAMMLAFNRSRERVNAIDVRGAVDQLQWVEFSARSDQSMGAADSSPSLPVLRDAGAQAEAEVEFGHVRIELAGEVVAELDLPVGKLTIGRGESNDVRIDSQYISRHHCQILTTARYSVIEDLQSQNGLRVGSSRVSVHRLRDGDWVIMGEHRLIFSARGRREAPVLHQPSPQSAPTADNAETRLLLNQAERVDSAESQES